MKNLAVITGGTKGIGKALVEKFASGGWNIVTCSRNEEDLRDLKTEVEEMNEDVELHIFPADFSDKNQVLGFVDFIGALHQPVEVLINNAGVFVPGAIHDEPEGVMEMMMKTNLYSAYYLTRGLIGEMKTRKSGHVFNICSTASITPYINGGSYCMSKYALYGMTKVLREEMKAHGVRVTAVLPGATRTASWEGTDLPEERFIRPEDVADAVWNAFSVSRRTVVEELLIRPQLGDI